MRFQRHHPLPIAIRILPRWSRVHATGVLLSRKNADPYAAVPRRDRATTEGTLRFGERPMSDRLADVARKIQHANGLCVKG
jgi:hypothetical protein